MSNGIGQDTPDIRISIDLSEGRDRPYRNGTRSLQDWAKAIMQFGSGRTDVRVEVDTAGPGTTALQALRSYGVSCEPMPKPIARYQNARASEMLDRVSKIVADREVPDSILRQTLARELGVITRDAFAKWADAIEPRWVRGIDWGVGTYNDPPGKDRIEKLEARVGELGAEVLPAGEQKRGKVLAQRVSFLEANFLGQGYRSETNRRLSDLEAGKLGPGQIVPELLERVAKLEERQRSHGPCADGPGLANRIESLAHDARRLERKVDQLGMDKHVLQQTGPRVEQAHARLTEQGQRLAVAELAIAGLGQKTDENSRPLALARITELESQNALLKRQVEWLAGTLGYSNALPQKL